MRILVTGGAGFIGSNYVRRIQDGTLPGINQVTVIDKLTYAGVLSNLELFDKKSNLNFIKGDITDADLIYSQIESVDAVINFAAESHVDKSILDSYDFVSSNIVGVQTILDAIKSVNKNVRFVQISTDEVYGSIESGSWDELSPLKPNSPYSATKASGDLLCRAYRKTHDLDVLVTRCSNNYGPYQFPEKFIPLMITNIIKGEQIPIYGDGKQVRDWLHVDDHCRAIHSVLMSGQSGEIYNVGGGRELSNLEIARIVLSKMNADPSAIEFVPDRPGHDRRYSVDWKKIGSQLDYHPDTVFEIGITKTIDWYMANVEWWQPLKRAHIHL